MPAIRPIIKAVISLKIANGHPRKPALTSIESTPVCGVLTRNAIVEAFPAPCFLIPIVAGMTESYNRKNNYIRYFLIMSTSSVSVHFP